MICFLQHVGGIAFSEMCFFSSFISFLVFLFRRYRTAALFTWKGFIGIERVCCWMLNLMKFLLYIRICIVYFNIIEREREREREREKSSGNV